MHNPSRTLCAIAWALYITGLTIILIFSIFIHLQVETVSAAPQINQGGGFLGQWCAQGDLSKQTSITGNGVFLTLTNENGDTSPGNIEGGQNVISAPGWQFVQGTLTPDGSQINWSNGTFWARCNNGGGGGGRRPRIEGTWYRGGNRSLRCSIRRRGETYRLTNEANASATASWDSRRQLTTNWSGTIINGIVTNGGNRINWSNGTFWAR
jgi:hypothetical protein